MSAQKQKSAEKVFVRVTENDGELHGFVSINERENIQESVEIFFEEASQEDVWGMGITFELPNSEVTITHDGITQYHIENEKEIGDLINRDIKIEGVSHYIEEFCEILDGYDMVMQVRNR